MKPIEIMIEEKQKRQKELEECFKIKNYTEEDWKRIKTNRKANIFATLAYSIPAYNFLPIEHSTISTILLYTMIETINHKNLMNEKKKKIENKELHSIINKKIMTTDEYKELEEEYNKYITKLASFFKKVGITSGVGVAALYSKLLLSGTLSHNNIVRIDNGSLNPNSDIYELLGCKVATGNSKYKHNCIFLTDLENELGNSSLNIPVNTISKRNENYQNIISVIKDKKTDNIIGYCPTDKIIYKVIYNNNLIQFEPIHYNSKIENAEFIEEFVNIYNKRSTNTKNNSIKDYLFGIKDMLECSKQNRKASLYIPDDYLDKYNIDISQEEIDSFTKETSKDLSNINSLVEKCYPKEISNKEKILNYKRI